MRAACEACGAAQPPDWKAGDLCTACGAAVRRDVRCFWCARWTPFAKFCRSCGAEVVEERLYGAARMIKDAGTDRFTVPKMLRELDPDQVENFTRIYQRQSVVVARHVDDLRFVERFLFHKSWSGPLEEELVPQLPLPEDRLKALARPPLPAGDDRATLRAIEEATPFRATKLLAALARIRLDDWKAWDTACQALRDPELRAEAVLVLTGWRVWSAVGVPRDRDLAADLGKSRFTLEAGVRLGLLGAGNEELLRAALGSPDRETAFTAALVVGDVDRLQAALQGDDLEKAAAGRALIRLGVLQPVVEPIRKSPLEVQQELVESVLRREGPVPELGEALLEIVEKTDDRTLRERAARALCRGLRPEWAMRIARAAKKDRSIFQSLLSEKAALPPAGLGEVAAFMIDEGIFAMHQYGLKEAGARGAISDDFVPARFPQADDRVRRELLGLAEAQLEERGDEPLHRFVMNVVFGEHPAELRAAAWWVLHRTYRRGDVRAEGPFRLEKASIERFFGSVPAFLPKLAAVLRDPATLKEVGVYEFLARLFSSAEPGLEVSRDVIDAVLEAVRGDYWPYLVDGMIEFLGKAGADPRWRAEVIAGLEALGKKGNYHWEKALRILRLSVHGIPDEPEWGKLPADFVPARFDGATPEGKLLLLQVADQQMVHQKSPEVLAWLLRTAFGPYDAAVRTTAMEMYDDRGGRDVPMKRPFVEAAFGPFETFVPRLVSVLSDPAVVRHREFAQFLGHLLREVEPALMEPLSAKETVAALSALQGPEFHNEAIPSLRQNGVRLLAKIGLQKAWRAEVRAALARWKGAPGYPFASDCEQGIRAIDDQERRENPPPEPVQTHPPASNPPVENPWVAKQKEAERLGRELQEAALRISFGPGTPEEKTREVMRLQAEFQARIQALYR